MSRTPITSPNAPAAIGPYSQAVRAGNTVYLSGQIPLDPATGNTRLANHFEFGRLECAASKQQRVIERLFDPHIKPGINTPTQKLN